MGLLLLLGNASPRPLLDTYTGSAGAYSLRQLRASAINCLRLRRSSDNAEQDFGFSGGLVDTASMLSFCGAGDGFVKTWYDQVGSANAIQATTGLQPRIVASGALETYSGKVTIRNQTANSNIGLAYPIVTQNSPCDWFGVFGIPTSETSSALIGSVSSSAAAVYSSQGNSSTTLTTSFTLSGVRKNGSAVSYSTRGDLYTALHTGALIQAGVVGTFANVADWTTTNRRFLANNLGTTFSPVCYYSEFILWKTDQSANRAAIDANQRTYWGIA